MDLLRILNGLDPMCRAASQAFRRGDSVEQVASTYIAPYNGAIQANNFGVPVDPEEVARMLEYIVLNSNGTQTPI